MGMTATEKIFARHAGRDRVRPGEIVTARVDRALLNDISGPIAFERLAQMGVARLRDPDLAVLVGDHFAPPKDVASARALRSLQRFADEHGVRHHYDIGTGGIEHTLLPELGLVRPGDLIVGGDSHTCTYGAFGAIGIGMGSTDIAAALAMGELWFTVPATLRIEFRGARRPYVTGKDLILHLLQRLGVDGAAYQSMEFGGPGMAGLGMDERMALCNMAVEAGAKTCIVPPDDTTRAWALSAPGGAGVIEHGDADAVYADRLDVALETLPVLCAQPYSPGNVAPVAEVRGVRVDQAYIGNCANGTLTDLRQAAAILRGRKVARGVRCVVVPATRNIYRQALAGGLIDIFAEAGALVSPSTCGACAGLSTGVLAEGQVCVATTNRNYRGRMGDPDSQVYLANAHVAAASAVAGELIHPEAL